MNLHDIPDTFDPIIVFEKLTIIPTSLYEASYKGNISPPRVITNLHDYIDVTPCINWKKTLADHDLLGRKVLVAFTKRPPIPEAHKTKHLFYKKNFSPEELITGMIYVVLKPKNK